MIGTAISIALAVLVKGVVGLFPVLIIGLSLFYFKSLKATILSKQFKYAILVFCIIALPWFICRFIAGPDFFIRMWNYDLLQRFNEPIEGHIGNWTYYFVGLQFLFGKIVFILLLIIYIYSLYLITIGNKPLFYPDDMDFLIHWNIHYCRLKVIMVYDSDIPCDQSLDRISS